MAGRAVGRPDARLVVQEWFSLTCTHCAHFALTIFPEVKTRLIDTGRIRFVFHDFPLDQLALAAAMLARSLPPDRYEPFLATLFATQDQWAFGQNNDAHAALQDAILAGQQDAKNRYGTGGTPGFRFDGTPSFRFDGTTYARPIDHDAFFHQVDLATR